MFLFVCVSVWLFDVKASPCIRKGMYKIPIMVYLDPDSIEAISADHDGTALVPEAESNSQDPLRKWNYMKENEKPKGNLNLLGNANLENPTETKDGTYTSVTAKSSEVSQAEENSMVDMPFLDSKSIAEQFIGSIFNEINNDLFSSSIQLQMIMQPPLDANMDCTLSNPLNSYLKYLETKHRDSTPFSKMFIIFCDNYSTFLDLNHGIYHSQKGKDFCTNHLGFLYVNNVILREKIKRGLFSTISQSKVMNNLSKTFFSKTCNYLHRCVDNRLSPVGSIVDFLRPIVHKGSKHIKYDMGPPENSAIPFESLLDELGGDFTNATYDGLSDLYDSDTNNFDTTYDNGYDLNYNTDGVTDLNMAVPNDSFVNDPSVVVY